MNAAGSVVALSSPVGKKRILLVDTYATKRDLRAKIMRKLGVEVDCAADISEARSLWQADSYSLVLVDVRNDSANVQEFCDEVRSAKPPQTVAFYVGKPDYLSGSPASEDGVPRPPNGHGPWGETVIALYASACEALPRRWGFQEASLRIAATRSLHDPRLVTKLQSDRKSSRWSWGDAVKRHSDKAVG
jgi:CheY-like chemotaxis protein